MLGYPVEDHIVDIRYYRPRGDDKEAWDNIDITGFMGQRMQIKVNFLCKDSILAAPLAIEIARVPRSRPHRAARAACRSSWACSSRRRWSPTATRRNMPSIRRDACCWTGWHWVVPRCRACADRTELRRSFDPSCRETRRPQAHPLRGREGSIAERAFGRLGACCAGTPSDVALRLTAAALAAARLGDLDAAVLRALGLRRGERAASARGLRCRGGRPRRRACARCCARGRRRGRGRGTSRAGFRRRPRAPAARRRDLPGKPRIVLEPPENHAEHCLVVAVFGVLLCPAFGADPEPVFLAALAHHLHNADCRTAASPARCCSGDHLGAVMPRHRHALAQLPEPLCARGRGGAPHPARRRHARRPRLPRRRRDRPRDADRPAPARREPDHGTRAGRDGARARGARSSPSRSRSSPRWRCRDPCLAPTPAAAGGRHAAFASRWRRRALAGGRRHRLSARRPRGADRRALGQLDAGERGGALALLLADQDDWWDGPAADAARLPPSGARARPLDFRDAMAALGFGRVGDYFAHRWSDPTFLAGLALMEAHWTGPADRLRARLRHRPLPARADRRGVAGTGADVVFAKLWLARHWVVRRRRALVCFDAAAPWPSPTHASTSCCARTRSTSWNPRRRSLARCARCRRRRARCSSATSTTATRPTSPPARRVTRPTCASLFPGAVAYDDGELTRAVADGARLSPRPLARLRARRGLSLCGGAGRDAPGRRRRRLALPRRDPLQREPALRRGPIAWPSRALSRRVRARATYPSATAGAAPPLAGRDGSAPRELVDLPERW